MIDPDVIPRVSAAKEPSILIVVIGTLRGGDMAWLSLQKHLLQPWHADLAVMTDMTIAGVNNTLLVKRATHRWHVSERKDWGEVLDSIPGRNAAWRSALCPKNEGMKQGQFLGGVADCQAGSAGILLAYRWVLQQRLAQMTQTYENIVLTRSDYLYLCDAPRWETLRQDGVSVPKGEENCGYTDRFAWMPAKYAMAALNVTRFLSTNATFWKEDFHNLESLLKRYWSVVGVKVHEFPFQAFTVKTSEDGTRWSKGKPDGEITSKYKLLVKYPGELNATTQNCGGSKHRSAELESLAAEAANSQATQLFGIPGRFHLANDSAVSA